nr:MAG TPA: hypothetical protein [Caudoviricetes sp.]
MPYFWSNVFRSELVFSYHLLFEFLQKSLLIKFLLSFYFYSCLFSHFQKKGNKLFPLLITKNLFRAEK